MKRRAGATVAAALGLVVASLCGVTPAHADADADASVLQALQDAAPSTLTDVTSDQPTVGDDVAVSDGGSSATVSVPSDPSDGISLSSASDSSATSSISIGLPFSTAAEDAQPVAAGIVAYDNNNGSTSVPIVKNDGSVQITTVISSPSAPSSYDYSLDLPAGATLQPQDGGGVAIVAADGSFIGGVAPAWAHTAAGDAVDTHYEINGSTLTQVVDLPSDASAYPLVADPWLGFDLIDHTKWANLWEYSPTLEVFPTWWGRHAGLEGGIVSPVGLGVTYVLARNAAWNETLSKTARSGHPNPNTSAMQNQFFCHWDVVRWYQPDKASWDLDSKFKDIGEAEFIRHRCNPTS